MITFSALYFWYWLGAVLTLITKWWVYVRKGKKLGNTTWGATKEWFFEASTQNAASWVATFAAVWGGGVIYIEQLPFPYLDGLFGLPHHRSIAFLLGSVMELAAPSLVKWLIRKIPGSGV